MKTCIGKVDQDPIKLESHQRNFCILHTVNLWYFRSALKHVVQNNKKILLYELDLSKVETMLIPLQTGNQKKKNKDKWINIPPLWQIQDQDIKHQYLTLNHEPEYGKAASTNKRYNIPKKNYKKISKLNTYSKAIRPICQYRCMCLCNLFFWQSPLPSNSLDPCQDYLHNYILRTWFSFFFFRKRYIIKVTNYN